MTNVVEIPIHMWDKCLAYIDRFLTEASRLLTRCRGGGGVDVSFLHFMGDDFLRLLLCRHVFACVVLRLHRSFGANSAGSILQKPSKAFRKLLPCSSPALPELDILDNPTLQRYTLDLALQLDVRHHFSEYAAEVD